DSNVHDSPLGDQWVPRLTGRGGPTVSPIGVGLAAVFAKKAPYCRQSREGSAESGASPNPVRDRRELREQSAVSGAVAHRRRRQSREGSAGSGASPNAHSGRGL